MTYGIEFEGAEDSDEPDDVHLDEAAWQEGTDALLSSLTSSTLPFERLRLCALQLWALLMLIWFEATAA